MRHGPCVCVVDTLAVNFKGFQRPYSRVFKERSYEVVDAVLLKQCDQAAPGLRKRGIKKSLGHNAPFAFRFKRVVSCPRVMYKNFSFPVVFACSLPNLKLEIGIYLDKQTASFSMMPKCCK